MAAVRYGAGTPAPPATAAFFSTRRARSAAWRRRSSPSIFRSRAGWSMTPTRSGRPSWGWRWRPCPRSARPPRISRPSASPTRERPPLSGTRIQGSRSIMPSSGSAAGPPNTATSLKDKGTYGAVPREDGACASTLISQPRSSNGFWTTCEGVRERAESGELLFGTVDTWLIWKLTKGSVHVTDYSNASRTMLFNIQTLEWDEEILAELKYSRMHAAGGQALQLCLRRGGSVLPRRPDPHRQGRRATSRRRCSGRPAFRPGEAKNTYGTGCFLLMNTGEKPVFSKNGLVTTIAWGLDGKVKYALEGSIFVAGAAIQWLRDEMQSDRFRRRFRLYGEEGARHQRLLCGSRVHGAGGPLLGSVRQRDHRGHHPRGQQVPHYPRHAGVAGLSDQRRSAGHEGGFRHRAVRAQGGRRGQQQTISSCRPRPTSSMLRWSGPRCVETTAMGAAYLAGLAVGYWAEQGRSHPQLGHRPGIPAGDRRGAAGGEDKRVEQGCKIFLRLGQGRVERNENYV